jgi:hypothetical protein
MNVPRFAREQPRTVEERDNARLAADARQARFHARGVEQFPLNTEAARLVLSEEQRALRSSRPRKRRWRELSRLDDLVDELTARLTDAGTRLQEAEAAVVAAPAADAQALADWIAGGERGERPDSTLYERERERDAARLLVEATQLEHDRVLERRLRFVEKNRKKMMADARSDVERARARLVAKANELPALREDLVAARELLLWSASFPDAVESFGSPNAVALGLREPVKRTLGTEARIDYQSLLAALEADAAALAESFSSEQKRQLGEPDAATPATEAMWQSDERSVAWAKEQLERARRLAEWSHDPEVVAAEVRDLRPG